MKIEGTVEGLVVKRMRITGSMTLSPQQHNSRVKTSQLRQVVTRGELCFS